MPKKKLNIIFVDGYGGRAPNPKTVCKGPCKGMGAYPKKIVRKERVRLKTKTVLRSVTRFRFTKCPDCLGTGRRS